jgi:quercetin dioxygenase-like cupin family protein
MSRDYKDCFVNINQTKSFRPVEGVEISIISGINDEKIMMTEAVIQPGCAVPEHKHPQEQIGKVISGRARVTIADEEKIVDPGDFCIFPPDTPHSAEAVGNEPFVMLDVFYPVREDFIAAVEL